MSTVSEHLTAPLHELPYGDLRTITDDENLLILAPSPADESLSCGGLIARSCSQGRPPFVMVLSDGSTSHPNSSAYLPDRVAALREQETRSAAKHLGLPAERLLMVGLLDGSIPEDGPLFEAVVRAITLVMWARDCNVICAPWRRSPIAEHRAAYRIAAKVAARSGVRLLAYTAQSWLLSPAMAPQDESADCWRLDITAQLPAKRAAIDAHASQHNRETRDDQMLRSADSVLVSASLQPYELFLKANVESSAPEDCGASPMDARQNVPHSPAQTGSNEQSRCSMRSR